MGGNKQVLAQRGVEEAAPAATPAAAPVDAPGVSTSQGAEEGGSQRPPSGEKRYQLTVAQRAKAAAVAGGWACAGRDHKQYISSMSNVLK